MIDEILHGRRRKAGGQIEEPVECRAVIAPADAIAAGDWAGIEERARRAAKLQKR